MQRILLVSICGLVCSSLLSGQEEKRVDLGANSAVVLNPGTQSYDHRPSASVTDDRTIWIAWHTYRRGKDGIAVRQVDAEGHVRRINAIHDASRTHGPPSIVVDSNGQNVWVSWANKVEDRWRLSQRTRDSICAERTKITENKVQTRLHS